MINVGLLGCGRWGRRLLQALVEHPRFELVAACDVSTQARAQVTSAFPLLRTIDSLAGLLHIPLDAVIVATPSRLHTEHALQIIAMGCDLLVEKPLALSSVDAVRMTKAANEADVVAMVGHVLCYHPAVSAFVSGARGMNELRSLSATRHSSSMSPDPLWTLGPHDLATLAAIDTSEVIDVDAAGGFDPTDPSRVEIDIRLASGLELRLDLSTTAATCTRQTRALGRTLLTLDELNCRPDPDPLYRELDHFADCVEQRLAPKTSFASAEPMIEVLARAQRQLDEARTASASSGAFEPQGDRTLLDHEPSDLHAS